MIHKKNVRELSSLIYLYTDTFPNLSPYFTEFHIIFYNFNGSSNWKKDLQLLVLKEKLMKNVRGSDQI